MSTRITLRLAEIELERLDSMAASEITGCENRCEFVRLLLAREWNRRKGLPKPTAKDYQSAFRVRLPAKVADRTSQGRSPNDG